MPANENESPNTKPNSRSYRCSSNTYGIPDCISYDCISYAVPDSNTYEIPDCISYAVSDSNTDCPSHSVTINIADRAAML